jgi:nicotinamide-nucleotide amidase
LKRAMMPVGATALPPVGTAPGLVVPASGEGPPVVVLPGPPRELQPMWPVALEHPAVAAALAARTELRQRTIRLWGTPESDLSALMREHDTSLHDLEITTCLRDGELEIVTRFEPEAQVAYDGFESLVASTYAATLLSTDGARIDDVVAGLLLADSLTIGTAESCTAGLLAGRLADRPGSSAYLLGGLVTYSNQAKHDLLGVASELIERVGAVSAEVAEAMADGARTRLGCDIGVGITGVAGPDGGTPDKPVGLVHLCAAGPHGRVSRRVQIPGARADVRARAVTIALHLVRELCSD